LTDPHFKEGFLWIPSLAGPMTPGEAGLGWLLNLQAGAPAIGWENTALYLIAPVLLVSSQIVSQKINMPPVKEETLLTRSLNFLPLLSGLTSISSPAGMSVYWLSNSVLSLT